MKVDEMLLNVQKWLTPRRIHEYGEDVAIHASFLRCTLGWLHEVGLSRLPFTIWRPRRGKRWKYRTIQSAFCLTLRKMLRVGTRMAPTPCNLRTFF